MTLVIEAGWRSAFSSRPNSTRPGISVDRINGEWRREAGGVDVPHVGEGMCRDRDPGAMGMVVSCKSGVRAQSAKGKCGVEAINVVRRKMRRVADCNSTILTLDFGNPRCRGLNLFFSKRLGGRGYSWVKPRRTLSGKAVRIWQPSVES